MDGWRESMHRRLGLASCLLFVTLLLSSSAYGQKSPKSQAPLSPKQALEPGPDLSKRPTLYAVGYAHLDTQWRWEYPQTIQEYLSKTMRNNFALFEKYPHYILISRARIVVG